MNDSIDATRGDHFCDHRIADVGAYEISLAEVVTWRDYIEPHDFDVLFRSKHAGEPGTQVT